MARAQSTPRSKSTQIAQPWRLSVESRLAKLVHTTYRINQRAFKIWQVEGRRKEREEREALGIIESRSEVPELSVVTLDSQLDKDMEE